MQPSQLTVPMPVGVFQRFENLLRSGNTNSGILIILQHCIQNLNGFSTTNPCFYNLPYALKFRRMKRFLQFSRSSAKSVIPRIFPVSVARLDAEHADSNPDHIV